MVRVISSALTFFYKFVFPLGWIAGFGLLAGPRDFPWPVFAVIWVFGSVAFCWGLGRLKRVAVDADGLVISNYVREVRIPWRGVFDARGGMGYQPLITVTFYNDIGFGTSITFMPKIRRLGTFQEHPVAQELRDLIRENRG